MRYWQMALRKGPGGDDMWPYCLNKRIAAIGYYTDPKNEKPVVTDCSKLSQEEYGRIWREKRPRNTAGRESLRRLAYEMQPKDVIYVREGIKAIVGKGEIDSGYKYDSDILKGAPIKWEHYVRVKWDNSFPRFEFNAYARWWTIYELKGEYLREIQTAEERERSKQTPQNIVGMF